MSERTATDDARHLPSPDGLRAVSFLVVARGP